ncbi:MAG: hypothetical protein J5556_06870, partial [Deltaproteobacteria bacterium]|nr:hypothetical protein [Deltaproteobacteria bacterium]
MSPSRRAQELPQLVVFAAQNDFLDSGREALCRTLLPPEMWNAILRYRRERDRRQRLLARLLLAVALRRLEGWPERLALERLEHEAVGRPCVRGCSWRISFSHAGEWVVCALGRAVGEIGVDVESIRPFAKAYDGKRRTCFGKICHNDNACGFAEIKAFAIGVKRFTWFGGT